MRGKYPIAAANENWLHESLAKMIKVVHEKQDLSQPVPSWAKLIPADLSVEQRTRLKGLLGVKSRLKNYETTVQLLTVAERAEILQIMQDQNDIGLLKGVTPISKLKAKYPNVHSAVHDLFVFAFGCLTALGVRDRQYSIIFAALEVKVCIFCGFERVMSPQETRQDQDHYLPKSIYAFAAANMKNLVPMCRCCNRDYKHDVDILLDANGERRKAYDPYDCPITDISLSRSIPFAGTGQRLPAWWIDFQPDTEEAETWDRIFCIRMRYARDVLNTGFNRWIESFMNRCKAMGYSKSLGHGEVLAVLSAHHQETLLENPVGIDFLKPKVFEMLLHHYQQGNQRVIDFVKDIVIGSKAPAY